jgi:hypothetical protein
MVTYFQSKRAPTPRAYASPGEKETAALVVIALEAALCDPDAEPDVMVDVPEAEPVTNDAGGSEVVVPTVAVLILLTVFEGVGSPLTAGSVVVVTHGDTRSGQVSNRLRSLSKGPVGPS